MVRISLSNNIETRNNINKDALKEAWRFVVNGIQNARNGSAQTLAARTRWFGGHPPALLDANLLALNTFINSNATLFFCFKDDDSYAYVYPDNLRHGHWEGNFIIYLGRAFNTALDATKVANSHISHGHNLAGKIVTIAHELAHLVLGANTHAPYRNEQYEDAAIGLALTDSNYAANNADNYGYFLEESS